ncbi:hypothetical protein CC2G_004321 [Coprinopsis cinerea AmutBmut pab1-1]|nr:hypothetical protein CC2G_004321 [Coprinopsis cinerea AmutBmut pab1-1]
MPAKFDLAARLPPALQALFDSWKTAPPDRQSDYYGPLFTYFQAFKFLPDRFLVKAQKLLRLPADLDSADLDSFYTPSTSSIPAPISRSHIRRTEKPQPGGREGDEELELDRYFSSDGVDVNPGENEPGPGHNQRMGRPRRGRREEVDLDGYFSSDVEDLDNNPGENDPDPGQPQQGGHEELDVDGSLNTRGEDDHPGENEPGLGQPQQDGHEELHVEVYTKRI